MLLESRKIHFKKTFLLAYPVIISQVGHVVVNITDSVLIGHLGPVKLAACSLGISVFAVLMVFGIGIAYGLTPHISWRGIYIKYPEHHIRSTISIFNHTIILRSNLFNFIDKKSFN